MDLDGTKVEETGPRASEITKESVKEMIEPFNKEELIEILQGAATRHVDTVLLEEIRKRAELKDPSCKNVFVADLAPHTTCDTLKTIFSSFGEVEECSMSRGVREETRIFGMVTFRHIDGAQRALKIPWKEIDGKMIECGKPGANFPALPMATRKIRVGNVSSEMTKDRLLARFAQFGEIEEGPHGFDKSTGRFQLNFGFSEIVYESADSAERASKEPIFRIDGNQMYCHLYGGRRKQNTGGTSRQAVNEELGQLSGELNEEPTPGRNQVDEESSMASQNQSQTIHFDWRNTESVPGIRQRMDGLALDQKLVPDMDSNGTKVEENCPPVVVEIAKEDVKEMIEPFNKEELIEILQGAATRHVDTVLLEEIRKLAELKDPSGKNLFVADLAPDTTSDTLKAIFSSFGEVEECDLRNGVMMSRVQVRGETRSFGLVTFRHIDGAQRALKVPWKEIDGKLIECKKPVANFPALPMATRSIRVWNVSSEMTKDRLLARFAQFGEIEEGPHGFDKTTGRFQLKFGFSEIVYKSADSADRASKEPIFRIDGNQMYCHLYGGRRKQNTGGTSQQAVNEELGQLRGDLIEELTPGRNQADEESSMASQNQSPTIHSDWRNTVFVPGIRQRMDGLALDRKLGPDMDSDETKVEKNGPPVISKEDGKEKIVPFNTEELTKTLQRATKLHEEWVRWRNSENLQN